MGERALHRVTINQLKYYARAGARIIAINFIAIRFAVSRTTLLSLL